jgi:hypothetical protein
MKNAVAEFVGLGKPYLSRLSAEAPVPRGGSVFYLGMLLIGNKGGSNLSLALRSIGLDVPPDPEALSRLARAVMSKYPG